jgi:hypothetical protein
MKNVLIVGTIFLWLLPASLALTYFWFHHPDIFPVFPHSFAIWLASVSSIPKDDLSILVGLFFSFVFMSVATYLFLKLWKKVCAR